MHWKIDDVPVYVAVVEHMGISAAAQALNLSKSKVSKSVARLEEALGVRLLERNSRNIRLTSDGRLFYQYGLQIMEQVSETNAVMAGLSSTPHGSLVAALPMAFCREFVAPSLEKFRTAYPQVELEIVITSHPVDIIKENIDLAVVVGSLNDSELIVKKLYEGGLVWVTSPDYINGNHLGDTLDDLLSHIHICEKRYGGNRFPVKTGDDRKYLDLSRDVMYVNDPIAVREAVAHGCGVSLLPNQYCKRYLLDGKLVQVYQHVAIDSSASVLSAIYPSRRLISNKARAFLEFLTELCARI